MNYRGIFELTIHVRNRLAQNKGMKYSLGLEYTLIIIIDIDKNTVTLII